MQHAGTCLTGLLVKKCVLKFVDDKLKHMHSPLPPLDYIPITIDPTCTMPVCLAMTFGNFGVFSGPFFKAIATRRYDCQFCIHILSFDSV